MNFGSAGANFKAIEESESTDSGRGKSKVSADLISCSAIKYHEDNSISD